MDGEGFSFLTLVYIPLPRLNTIIESINHSMNR